jgi:hypothetical protein
MSSTALRQVAASTMAKVPTEEFGSGRRRHSTLRKALSELVSFQGTHPTFSIPSIILWCVLCLHREDMTILTFRFCLRSLGVRMQLFQG